MSEHILHDAPSFLRRLAAGFIDILVIIAVTSIIGYLCILAGAAKSYFGFERVLGLYYSFLSQYNTLGGYIFNILVIKKNGEKITLNRAFFRSFIILMFYILAFIVCYINYENSHMNEEVIFIFPALGISAFVYLIVNSSVIFTKDKKSLVDLLSGTRVVCIDNKVA